MNRNETSEEDKWRHTAVCINRRGQVKWPCGWANPADYCRSANRVGGDRSGFLVMCDDSILVRLATTTD